MSDLALIAVGVGVGLLVGVKLTAWAAICCVRWFVRLLASWVHRAL